MWRWEQKTWQVGGSVTKRQVSEGVEDDLVVEMILAMLVLYESHTIISEPGFLRITFNDAYTQAEIKLTRTVHGVVYPPVPA